MNVFNHIIISMKIKRSVEDNFPVKLKTLKYLYGSIKPDISRKFSDIPHYKADSEEFVKEELEKILQTDYSDLLESKGDFSERLGVLTHYLSDFFCHAHSERFDGGRLSHGIYEMKLMFYCGVKLRKVSRLHRQNTYSSGVFCSDICGFIDRLHVVYSDSERIPSLIDDISFAHEACFAMYFTVLASCLAEESGCKLELAEAC